MKLNPALLAIVAGGVAALLLLRPKAAAREPQKGFFDRVTTWADAFPTSPAGEAIKANVESRYGDLVDWLRRVDPRPDPIESLSWFERGFVPEAAPLTFTPAGPMGMAF